MSSNLKIFLRNEVYENEIRTPLIPSDIKILINNNFTVFVESCPYRIYADELYEKEGAIITLDKWYDIKYKNFIIIGIKELNYLEKLNKHTHLYFSHSYKKQKNSGMILNAFIKSHSKLYDFEYFLNNQENRKRIIAFGYFAGLVGAVLGVKQFYNKINKLDNIKELKPWITLNEMIEYVKIEASYITNKINDIKIGIIGSNGRCGKGVQFILDTLNIKYIEIEKEKEKEMEINFDILFNCILLDRNYNNIWYNSKSIFNKNLVIVDISCDYTKINNPIQLYNSSTSWNEPVFKYNEFVDIIAIENLPSLLPYESSNDFSKKCTELLLQYDNEIWNNNLLEFYNAIFFI